jgi:hypothetical protein
MNGQGHFIFNQESQMSTHSNRGFALVFALLMLLTMTVIAVSLMSGSHMQERMAGNARLQSLAFQGATAGVTDAVAFVGWSAPSGLVCGETDYAAYAAMWLDGEGRPRPTDWLGQEQFGTPVPGANVQVQSRLYCLWDAEQDQGRSNLYVESEGSVNIGGLRFANRSVEVRVVSGLESSLGDPTCAVRTLCDPSRENPLSAFNPPSSQASFVGGDTGHAICACSDAMRQTITSRIRANRQRSYTGVGGEGADAIGVIEASPPFDTVANFLAFIEALRQIAIADNTFTANGHSGGFDWPDQVRFIEGDLYAAGGNFGSGILVVTGDIELRGNFRYDGLIIGLGTELALKGAGGNPHGVRGSVVAGPVAGDPPSVGQVNLSFHEPGGGGGAGGGGVSYAFDCDALVASEGLLTNRFVDDPVFGQKPATDYWRAECDGGVENIFEKGPAELQLVSWRENLGWRERIGFFSANTIEVSVP